jgi:hypothetical protein
MGRYGPDFHASIGGYVNGKRLSGDWIVVETVGGKEVNQTFKLAEVYAHIKSGQASLPLDGQDV